MQFNQTVPLLSRPKFAEGTKLSSERDSRNNSQLWKKGESSAAQIDALLQAVQKLSREVAKQRRRIVGGGGMGSGIKWQDPKELDPTVFVPANTLVYISPLNPLVTVGLVDLDSSGATLQATAGEWLSLLDVPAKTSSGYNMPQDPVPKSGVTAPSGSPLKGDLDVTVAPKVYWILQKSVC